MPVNLQKEKHYSFHYIFVKYCYFSHIRSENIVTGRRGRGSNWALGNVYLYCYKLTLCVCTLKLSKLLRYNLYI